MKTVMRPRYYCDHCNKGSGSPSAMKRHERGCTVNPNRVCGMCAALVNEGGEAAAPIDELRRVLDAEGFYAMCKAANDCPACILTVLHPLNFKGDGESPPGVSGPQDGREVWSYSEAKKDWWAEFNDSDCRSYPVCPAENASAKIPGHGTPGANPSRNLAQTTRTNSTLNTNTPETCSSTSGKWRSSRGSSDEPA